MSLRRRIERLTEKRGNTFASDPEQERGDLKFTILIVDDKRERLATLSAVLEHNGYDVISALNGSDALRLLLTNPVDLVVLDYYMPVMSGGTVAMEMRRMYPAIPIIIYSGALTLPDLVISMVDGFISTSEEPEILLSKISELLQPVLAKAAS
jgi:two-component system, sensor histidine kinase and response regulator